MILEVYLKIAHDLYADLAETCEGVEVPNCEDVFTVQITTSEHVVLQFNENISLIELDKFCSLLHCCGIAFELSVIQ